MPELIVGEVVVFAGETGSFDAINARLSAQIASSATQHAVPKHVGWTLKAS
jgi:hypothetical protein